MKLKRIFTAVIFAATICSGLAHAGPLRGNACRAKVTVLSSIPPLAHVARELLGDRIESVVLLNRGTSPHHFQLKPSHLIAMKHADILLWVGPQLEQGLAPLASKHSLNVTLASNDGRQNYQEPPSRLQASKLPIASSPWEKEKIAHPHSEHNDAEAQDVHPWLNISAVQSFVNNIAEAYVSLCPAEKDGVDKQLLAMTQILSRLDQDIAGRMRELQVPVASYHQSLDGFAKRYKVTLSPSLTRNPGEQISAKRLKEIKRSYDGVRCLISDIGEIEKASRYARLLNLPLREVDLLGVGASNYSEILSDIASTLEACQ